MELRAHHLLCLPMYRGHGYSEDFCMHMNEMIRRIRVREAAFRILASPDEVCTRCPHLLAPEGAEKTRPAAGVSGAGERRCDEEERICRRDILLLDGFGLTGGRSYGREELREKVLSGLTEELFRESCGTCTWYVQGFCSYEMWRDNFTELF